MLSLVLFVYLVGFFVTGVLVTYFRARNDFFELLLVPAIAFLWPLIAIGWSFRVFCIVALDPAIERLRQLLFPKETDPPQA